MVLAYPPEVVYHAKLVILTPCLFIPSLSVANYPRPAEKHPRPKMTFNKMNATYFGVSEWLIDAIFLQRKLGL